jgi:hypothetical protein
MIRVTGDVVFTRSPRNLRFEGKFAAEECAPTRLTLDDRFFMPR